MVVGIFFYPIANAILISLHSHNLVRPMDIQYIGIENFKYLSEDHVFWKSLWQTVRWAFIVSALQMVLGLPVALFLNLDFSWRGFARTVVLIPWVVPPIATSIIWTFMFDGNFGVINDLLVRVGLIPKFVGWLSDDFTSFIALVVAMLWTGFPFMAIMLLAALQTIPAELYEAARVDGANAWQRFTSVTFPQILPTILLLLLLRTMWLANHVDIIYLMTLGGPAYSNYTLSVYSYILTTISYNVGYASAVALVVAVMLLITSTIYVRYIERTREFVR